MSAETRGHSRVLGRALMALGCLCLVCALALALHNQREDDAAGAAAAQVAASLAADAQGQTSTPPAGTMSESVVIDGVAYCGTLEIPALALRLPVKAAWDGDYEALKLAPCRQFGAPVTGDLVIAGHNYASHFGGLRNLAAGDVVTFTDLAGTTWRYAVALVEVLPPTAVDEVRTSPWALTLYTCTYGGASRVVVRCAAA